MRTGLSDVLERLSADLPDLGQGRPYFTDADPDMPKAVGYGGHQVGIGFTTDPETLLAFLADQFQDDVIDALGRTWPEVDGRPLLAKVDGGQAWWLRDNVRYAPIGRLHTRHEQAA